jgi:hypothetical protein
MIASADTPCATGAVTMTAILASGGRKRLA